MSEGKRWSLEDAGEAFAIFAKYAPDARFEVAAEHGIVYAGRNAEYSAEDKARLEVLGWNYDTSLECYFHYV